MTPQTNAFTAADAEHLVPAGLAELLSDHHVSTLKKKARRDEIRAVISANGRWLFDRRDLIKLAAKRRPASMQP
jgi:hypothetical protein